MDFSNNLIQEQNIWEVLPLVLSKRTFKQRALSEKECHQIKEIEQLWTQCCDTCSVISLAAVEVLLQLVTEYVVEFNYVMHGFLAQITSTRHLLGPIHGITKLLCLQITKNTEDISYSLSSNAHPYITVLANCAESWSMLLQEIDNLFQTTDNSSISSLLHVFEAFFQHVLYNPKPDYAACKSLYSLLLEKASELSKQTDIAVLDKILSLITNHIRLYKTNMASLGHSVSLCQQTLRWLLKNGDAELERHMQAMALLLVELVLEQLNIGMSMMSSLVVLRKITQRKPWIALTSGSVFLISHLLLKCSEYYRGELVHIASNLANHILSNSDVYKPKLSFLVVPLLQILSSKRHAEKTAIFSLASQLLSNVESSLQTDVSNFQTENKAETCSVGGGVWLKNSGIPEKMFQLITTSDKSTLLNWLKSVESSIRNPGTDNKDLSFISLLLSSFLLTCSDTAAFHVLGTIVAICRADPTQAPYFFPMMLYKMERCSSPEVKLHVLQTVPKLATHKVCVKQVLGILLVLNNNSELKAITLRLMFRLWTAQPRVFGQLHKLLQEKTRPIIPQAWTELQLARAVTIRDICRERPSQHGEDLIGLISAMINENAQGDSKTNAVLVCLSLESLQALVAAEVLNLPSTWEMLKTKLEYHSHPLVLGALCGLFSLVPSLADHTKEYEDFKEYVLSFLWKYSELKNESVADEAFKALAKFERNDFLIRHLTKQVRQKMIQHLQSSLKIKKIMQESSDKGEKTDLEAFPIPVYYYIELLETRIPVTCNQGLEDFLGSVIAQEITRLPQGLAYSVMKAAETSETKLMSSIPELLKKHYDKCKQPALKGRIAASLLYCYELHVEKRSGKPMRSQAVNNIKLYRQLINQLVQEVPVKSSDWHFNTDISQAWTAFLSRVFKSYVEGRKMELELQKEREHISEGECNTGMQNAWLWARDTLTDLLKTASKGTHIMQGNSVLALAGLAATVYTYKISSENNSQAASVTNNSHTITEEWIACVTDTMLVILDGSLQTHGDPITWCQQVSSTGSSSSSTLARACAAISLAQVAPALLSGEFERLKQVLDVLQRRIPGQAKQGSSPVILNHCSVGLGLALQKLYQEKISDSLGQEGDLLLAKTLDALENAALSSHLQNTEGAIFGLGLSISSINKETESLVRTKAQSMHSKMVQFFERLLNSQDSQKLKVLGTALAHSTAGLFAAELLESESLEKIVQLLKRLMETFSQNVVLASAFGMFLYNIKSFGLAEVSEMLPYWASHWQSVITNTALSPSSRVAAVSGLSALLGSQINQTEGNFPSSKRSHEDGVKMLKQLLDSHGDINFTGNVYWNISKLCFAHKKLLHNQSNVPNTLEYLGEDSVMNCLIRVLTQLGEQQAPQEWEEMLNIILRVLTNGPKERFPPLNWNIVISPLVKRYTGTSTTGHLLAFALCSPSSPATASFLPSWLTSSVVLNLTVECKVRLYSSLHQLVDILSTKKLRDILEFGTKYFLQDEIDIRLAEAILDGLYSVLKMSGPSQSVFPYIKNTVEKIYHCFPSNLEMLISKLAACIEFLTTEEVEILTEPKEGSQLKSLMFRREIILKNPLLLSKLLKPFIDLTISTNIQSDTLAALISTFFRIKVNSNDDRTTEWIMQLLAHLASPENHTETISTILLLLTVISLAVCPQENHALTAILLLQNGQSCQDHRMWFSSVRDLFPRNLAAVLAQPQWKTRIEKIIDKLLVILKSSRNTESSRLVLDCLLELRNLDVLEKRSVWTQVVSSV